MRTAARVSAMIGRAAAAAAPAGPQLVGTPTTGTGSAPTIPAHVAGDVLVVFTTYQNSPGANNATGWTRRLAASGGAANCFLYAHSKVAAGPGETLSLGVTPDAFLSVVVRGAADVNVAANGTVSAAPNILCPSVTTTGAPALLLSGYTSPLSAVGITPAGGQSAVAGLVTGATTILLAGYETVQSAGATGTRTGTISGTGNSVGGSIAVF